MSILHTAQFEYKKYEDSDCLVSKDLHSMNSDGSPDHTNCEQWCNNHGDCGGFAVWSGTCYFKNVLCGNKIVFNVHVDIYLKQGM